MGIDTDPASDALDAAFDDITNAELRTDLSRVHKPAAVTEGGIGGDYERLGEARQIGGQIFGDGVGKILLIAIGAQIGEGQNDDRQPRSRSSLPNHDECRPTIASAAKHNMTAIPAITPR